MPIVIESNIASLQAQHNLGKATATIGEAYQRLASGSRINKASDDAAGLAISTALVSKARVFKVALRNVNDGISAANIAEGALNSLKDITQRQLELAEQAANGTYSQKQRQALNSEANTLVSEFNRVAGSTTFNKMNLLDPSLGSVLIQAGYGQGGGIQFGLTDKIQRAFGDGTFASGVTLTTGGTVSASTTGDFNNDGRTDLLAFNTSGETLTYLGNADGSFKAVITSQSNVSSPEYVIAGDFNGDGNLDTVGTARYTGAPYISLGNGNGTFRTGIGISGSSQKSLAAGDFNGDGKLDLVIGDYYGGLVQVQIGDGRGNFSESDITPSAGQPLNVATGDFDGDGKADFITSTTSGLSQIYLGNGNGSFRTGPVLNAGSLGTSGSSGMRYRSNLQVGDFDADGSLDAVVATSYGGTVAVFLGNGNGSFKAARSLAVGTQVKNVQIADFDGDGRLDLIATDSYDQYSKIFFGNGNGTFKAVSTISSASPRYLALGDLNGDGRLDLVAAPNPYAGQVQIMYGQGGYTVNERYLNISSRAGALNALTEINGTLSKVTAQLGSIGAVSSRFSTVIPVLQAESENFYAAAGRIQDADIAAESATVVRAGILQQAGAAVLAHANQMPTLALQLLT